MSRRTLRMPAEWERQSGVMLTWPDNQTDWRPYIGEAEATMTQLALAIARHENVVVAARHPEQVRRNLEDAAHGTAAVGQIRVYQSEIDDTWARDHGPISLIDADGSPILNDFRFNGWGEKFPWQRDNAITRTLYVQGAFTGELLPNDDFVLEGGSIECDGAGTVLTTRGCLLAPRRNQPLSEKQIDAELRRRLHAGHVIWIDGLQLEGDDTDGHIDTIARFAPGHIILYIDDSAIPSLPASHKPLRRQLEEATADIPTYRLVGLPMPEPVFYEGEKLPATYANFLVINGAVIVPSYRQPRADDIAASIISGVFPGHELIQIDASAIVRQHGSLHCLTMQLY